MADLVNNEPLVSVNQTQTTNTVNNTLNLFGQNFNDTIRDVNSQLKEGETKLISPLELIEGKQDYITAEFEMVNEREKENV
jgi:hypothetical protein